MTITDALEAGALRGYGTFGNRGLLAAEAGMDLILCSQQDVSEGEQAAAGLEDGYRDGAAGQAGVRGGAAARAGPAGQPPP